MSGWSFTPEEARLVIDWMIGLMVQAINRSQAIQSS
jgi:hypothetical protein